MSSNKQQSSSFPTGPQCSGAGVQPVSMQSPLIMSGQSNLQGFQSAPGMSQFYPNIQYMNYMSMMGLSSPFWHPYFSCWPPSAVGQMPFQGQRHNGVGSTQWSTLCVNKQVKKGKTEIEVIDIESDENPPQTISDVPQKYYNQNHKTQKTVEVIELDENSQKEIAKKQSSNISTEQVLKRRKRIPRLVHKKTEEKVQKIQRAVRERKQKSTNQQHCPEAPIVNPVHSSRKRIIAESGNKKKKLISKQQKTNAKKNRVVQSTSSTAGKHPVQKKFVINPETLNRQIAKYPESHGQIRLGNEFQSQIPTMGINNCSQFRTWIQKKKQNIRQRQVGTLSI